MNASLSGRVPSEKEKIKEMLRDAIRILCQNTVSHRTKLSIEGVIGITVDDDERSIIISINESVGGADSVAYQMNEQYENTDSAAYYQDYEPQDTTVNYDNEVVNNGFNYGGQYNAAVPYEAVVKQETSVITYNVGQYDTFANDSISTNETPNRYFVGDGSCTGYKSGAASGQVPLFSGVRGRHRGSRPPRSRGRGGRVSRLPQHKMTNVRTMPAMPPVKQEQGMDVDTTTGSVKCSVDTPEVSHVTLYTCQRCGKQFNNNSSFVRHKKSHLGIVYRCDGCGKILSRSDHLVAHRRRCSAALDQPPLDN